MYGMHLVPENIIVKFSIKYIHILKTANGGAKLSCGKFNTIRICTSGNYSQNWIMKFYNY
jgi:hypothetical protein